MPQPINDFVANDTLLVLDLLQGAWVGQWRSEAFRLRFFAPYYEGDDPRLCTLGADGECHAFFQPGYREEDATENPAIVSEVRASIAGDVLQKQGATVVVDVETLGSRYRVSTEADGAGEVDLLPAHEPDPEASLRRGVTIDFTNAGDDLIQPYREDYSHEIPAEGMEIGEEGWNIGARQRWHKTYRIRRRNRSLSVAVASGKGITGVRGIGLLAPAKPAGRGTDV